MQPTDQESASIPDKNVIKTSTTHRCIEPRILIGREPAIAHHNTHNKQNNRQSGA
jgi:hypothetical protein